MRRACRSSWTRSRASTTCRRSTRRPHSSKRDAAGQRLLHGTPAPLPARALAAAGPLFAPALVNPAATTRRILGIDPGLRVTGFGVIDVCAGRLVYRTCGCIRSAGDDLPERLAVIVHDLAAVIAEHRPTEAAIEKVFVNVNPRSTLLLGQARGAAISAAVLAALPVAEYTALQVKQAVVGHGKAAKEQVQDMVRRLLGLPGTPSPDAADALACAICHAHGPRSFDAVARASHRTRAGRPA